jgi:hypothetical protein
MLKIKTPQFGILSLSAFLALREAYDLNVLGVVHMKNDGGRKYHVVTKSAGSLASCRGKKLASLFGKDEQFIDNVVADGDFSLEDFKVVNTTNPLKTVRKVIRGAANAALIDNAQFSELAHIDGGDDLKAVWSSATLPPVAVVSFFGTPDPLRAKFKQTLGSLGSGEGKAIFDKLGIQSIQPKGESVYAEVIAAYE